MRSTTSGLVVIYRYMSVISAVQYTELYGSALNTVIS